jgi:hypothetical protein
MAAGDVIARAAAATNDMIFLFNGLSPYALFSVGN